MNIGFSLSNNQGLTNVQDVVSVAARAEELGYDSVWASDHVFNVSYVYERLGNRPYYDPMTILTYAAAQTSRVILGTSVLVLPYHNPMRLAKQAATLDQLSGGRVALGVGVGVIDTEIEALGVPFSERGPYTDESIEIMKTLWCDDEPRYEGRFFQFADMAFSPRPVRPEGIPLIIGGTSRAAIRRAARHGDGWHPTAMPPEDLAQGIRYLHERAERADRDPATIPVSVSVPLQGGRPGPVHAGRRSRGDARQRPGLPGHRRIAHRGVALLRRPGGGVPGNGDRRGGGHAGGGVISQRHIAVRPYLYNFMRNQRRADLD